MEWTSIDLEIQETKEVEITNEASTESNKYISVRRLWAWFKDVVLNRNNTWGGNNTFNKNVIVKGESSSIGNALEIKNINNEPIAKFLNNKEFDMQGYFKIITNSNNTAFWSSNFYLQFYAGSEGEFYVKRTTGQTNLGINRNKSILNSNFEINGSSVYQQNYPLFAVNGLHTGSIPYPRMTESQRSQITLLIPGMIVYQTDGIEGVYVYKSTGWSFAY